MSGQSFYFYAALFLNYKTMPINYKDYHPEWLSIIRPDILKRGSNRCEVCKVPNGTAVFRGFTEKEREVFQDRDGNIYETATGEFIKCDCYELIRPSTGNENQKAIKIVLTVAHLDHDINNNDYSNLKALCQLHHLRLDVNHHKQNSRQSREKKSKLQRLF